MTGPSCQPIIHSGQIPDHVVVWGDTGCRITSPLWWRCFLQHFPSAGLLLWDPAAGLLCDTAMGQLLATKGKHVQDLRDTVRLVRLLLAMINTEEHPKASLLRMSGSWIALLGSLETPASVTFWGYIEISAKFWTPLAFLGFSRGGGVYFWNSWLNSKHY